MTETLRDKLLNPTEKALAIALVDFCQRTEGILYSAEKMPTAEEAKNLLLELTQISPNDPITVKIVYKLVMPNVNWDNVIKNALQIMKPDDL